MTDIAATRSHLQTALDGLQDALRTLANEWVGTEVQKADVNLAILTAQIELSKARRELK